MMARHIVGRILHVTYPAIVFTIVFLIWSSSNLAEVAYFAPPPVSDGFNFIWNPAGSSTHTCSENRDSNLKLRQVCQAGSRGSSLDQFTNSSKKTTN